MSIKLDHARLYLYNKEKYFTEEANSRCRFVILYLISVLNAVISSTERSADWSEVSTERFMSLEAKTHGLCDSHIHIYPVRNKSFCFSIYSPGCFHPAVMNCRARLLSDGMSSFVLSSSCVICVICVCVVATCEHKAFAGMTKILFLYAKDICHPLELLRSADLCRQPHHLLCFLIAVL